MIARAIALFAAVLIVAPAAADSSNRVVHRSRALMGSNCTIVADSTDTSAVHSLERALDEVERLEHVLNLWVADSELTRLNENGLGFWFTCSPDLYALVDSSLKYAERTEGAFDPTIEALNKVWDIRGNGKKPKPKMLERARASVGWRHVSKDSQRRRILVEHEEAGLDLGGICKGYALSRAAGTLRGSGVQRALLHFGDEVQALGAWEATVPDPADRTRPVLRVQLENESLATTGQTPVTGERGRRYGHVLDPRTGEPIVTSATVTVVCRSATEADALSTAFLIMGREAAAAYVATRPRLGLVWMEPAAGGVQAWKWNLADVAVVPGVSLQWMN